MSDDFDAYEQLELEYAKLRESYDRLVIEVNHRDARIAYLEFRLAKITESQQETQ